MTPVLVALIAIPLVGALFCALQGKTLARVGAVLASLTVAVLASIAVAVAAGWTGGVGWTGARWSAFAGGAPVIRGDVATLPWLEGMVDAPLFGVLLDPLGAVLLLVVAIIGFLTVLYSTAYVGTANRSHAIEDHEQGRYYFWLLLFLASMVGVALSPNFLQLFVFWELTTVCSWALISFHRDDVSLRAGFKALLMTHAGGLFFLLALLLLFVQTGSFEFDALARLPGGFLPWVFVLLMVAAWAKAAQVPLHTWLPDAMEAPTPISAYLHAAAMVKAGVFLMARSVSAGWAMPWTVGLVLGAMALVTILLALSSYFAQDDLKRLLAWSTIAHLGYVLVGVSLGALGSTIGFRGGVLHILCHGFSKATLFLCVGSVATITGSRSISAIQGLGRTMPLTATAFFVGVMSVAGVPPFACFWSKLMILQGAISLPGVIGPILLVVLLAETLVAFGWMLWVAQKVFLGAPSPVAQVNSEPPAAMGFAVVVLVIGCLVAPWFGIPLVEQIGR